MIDSLGSVLQQRRYHFLSLVVLFVIVCLACPSSIICQGTARGSTNPQSTATRLEADHALEKALAGGHSDTYEFAAASGQFLHVVVEQLGIDVALTLSGPDGKQIGSMDSPNGAFGLEQISAIAYAAGIYHLQISSGDKTALSGRYRVTLAALKLPSDTDRGRVTAERKFTEAIALQEKGDAESLRRAIQEYEESLSLWKNAGDAYEEALTLVSAGEIYSHLGNKKMALDYFQQALPIWQAAGDRDGEAAVLLDFSSTYSDLGEFMKALDYAGRALPLTQAVGDRSVEARALINIGFANTRLGEKQEALESYGKALTITRDIGDISDECSVLNNIGRVNEDLGEYARALGYYAQALPLEQAQHNVRLEAITLNNIGLAHDGLGEEQVALDYYTKSLPLRLQVGDLRGEATSLNNIALIYSKLGLHQKALEYYEQALPLRQQIGDRSGEALELHNIGQAYADLEEFQEALKYFDRVLPLYRDLLDRDGQALTLNGIGQIYVQLRETQKALEYFNQALPLEDAVGSRVKATRTYTNIGLAYDALGERQKAVDNYSHALGLAKQLKNPIEASYAFMSLMAHWKEMGNLGAATFFGKEAVNQVQLVRQNILGMDKEAQQSFLKLHERVFRDLAELLIAQGRLPEAQQVLDLLKLEEFSEFTQRRGDTGSNTKPMTLTPMEEKANKEYELIAADITAIGSEFDQLKAKSSRAADEEKRLNELSDKLKAANRRIEIFFSGLYDSFGKGDQANIRVSAIKDETAGLQEKLAAGTAGIYTVVSDHKCDLILVTPATQVAHEVQIEKIALRAKVYAFLDALAQHESDQDIQSKSQALYNILIAPIEKDLHGAQAKTLVWSLDDVLRYVPVAALYDGKQYLVERYRNVVITTVSAGNLDHQPQLGNLLGLAMGVSKDYDGLGQLRAVPGELDSVVRSNKAAGSHGPVPGTILLDDSFTETSMESALDQHPPLVHIASHYVFQPGDDKKSYLLLGGKETGGQGYHLTLADLRDDQRMDFKGIELFTLSGCQTGLGSNDSDGREIDGLGITAQRKGAKAVMATLWLVDDASVGQLMATFYKLWITKPGMTKSEALQQAQLGVLHGTDSQYRNPYYWAPFILIGNWK